MKKQRNTSALLSKTWRRMPAGTQNSVADLSLVLNAVDKFGRQPFQLKLADELCHKNAMNMISECEQGAEL